MIRQLWFDFLDAVHPPQPSPPVARAEAPQPAPVASGSLGGRDSRLESDSRGWLLALGLHEGAAKVQVTWNAKLRSTAGYARWPQWQVELNPRLRDHEGQVERTLKHELAHLIAYARAGRRRIKPHGDEWRQACADLGIADESARHTLPLPRARQQRKLVYACASCGVTVQRVRPFRRHTACLACCRKHTGGRYDARFRFVLLPGGEGASKRQDSSPTE